MTGQQVLDALVGLTPEQLALNVETEGCDCYGEVGAVAVTLRVWGVDGLHSTEYVIELSRPTV